MTIDRAIEIMHQDLGADTYDNHLGLYEAQKLGIEALKRELKHREGTFRILLPGETEK